MGCLESTQGRPVYAPQPRPVMGKPVYGGGPYGGAAPVQAYEPQFSGGPVVQGYAPGQPCGFGGAAQPCQQYQQQPAPGYMPESYSAPHAQLGMYAPGAGPAPYGAPAGYGYGGQPGYGGYGGPQPGYQGASAPAAGGGNNGMMMAGAGLAGLAGGFLAAEVLDDIF
mmetsp:Transcript_56280/g.163164  ORF Transcript_56280/g.163164 Transcript_56280/m.163164 type:complete len:167 (+) Transcript_56280:95-595(+)